MIDLQRLRGEIVTVFRTQHAFADAMGWYENKVSNLLNGKYILSLDEAVEIAEKLNMTIATFQVIFLPGLSPNVNN